jgi:hypothetical protein
MFHVPAWSPVTMLSGKSFCRAFTIGCRGRDDGCPVAPRTDPYVQITRIRLLPWVSGAKAHIGIGMEHSRCRQPSPHKGEEALPR